MPRQKLRKYTLFFDIGEKTLEIYSTFAERFQIIYVNINNYEKNIYPYTFNTIFSWMQ
jgi:hypothetical protein